MGIVILDFGNKYGLKMGLQRRVGGRDTRNISASDIKKKPLIGNGLCSHIYDSSIGTVHPLVKAS